MGYIEIKHEELLGFKTKDEWSVADLQTFLNCISTIYNIFLAFYLKNELDKGLFGVRGNNEKILVNKRNIFLLEPIIDKFSESELPNLLVKDLVGKTIIAKLPSSSSERKIKVPTLSDFEIFKNIERYTSKEKQLHIHSIKIASPGEINLKGLGEVIRELRELVKDIWYKNKQEKELGNLEYLDRYLSLQKKHSEINFKNKSKISKRIVLILDENFNILKKLEKQEKLEGIAENIDCLPKNKE